MRKRLTKHGDEFLLDFIDLAGLFRVPIGCGTKYRGRRLDLRGMSVVKMTKVSFERIWSNQLESISNAINDHVGDFTRGNRDYSTIIGRRTDIKF